MFGTFSFKGRKLIYTFHEECLPSDPHVVWVGTSLKQQYPMVAVGDVLENLRYQSFCIVEILLYGARLNGHSGSYVSNKPASAKISQCGLRLS